jgi:hypothetical protein
MIINYSVILTISLNCFNHALVQPLVRVACVLDLVNLKNLPRLRGGEACHGGDVCVVCCALINLLIPMYETYGVEVFCSHPNPYSGKAVFYMNGHGYLFDFGRAQFFSVPLKKYAHGYLPSLPIFYVFAERGEYIKDTFGRARHRKLARWAGRTSCTPCSLVSRSHGRCSHLNHSF